MPATFDLLLYRGRQSRTQHSHLFLEHTYEMRLDYTRKRGARILFTPSCDLSHSSFVTYTEKNKGTHSSMTRSHNCLRFQLERMKGGKLHGSLRSQVPLTAALCVGHCKKLCDRVKRRVVGKKKWRGLQETTRLLSKPAFYQLLLVPNSSQSAPISTPTFVQQSPYSTLCFDAMSISAAENKQQTESAQLQEKMEKGTEDQAWNSAV